MTSEQWRELLKTGAVVAFGVLMLLSAFGPLAQYRDWLLLAAGVVSIIASTVFGVNLKTPAQQVQSIKVTRAVRLQLKGK